MYTIIDVETTGGSAKNHRITEIALFLYDGQKITDQLVTLINPECNIPYYISRLTGITNAMVADAPKFYEVARRIVELTENRIFVAHNAHFDYGFVREEFKRLGYDFKRQQLCTVKLSRRLIPGHRSYSLGKICAQLGITIENRHRAAGDARATVQLFEYLLAADGQNKPLIGSMTRPATGKAHAFVTESQLKSLPAETGVYYLHNQEKDIIYIGKSNNIRQRVMSHLNNAATRRAAEMQQQIASISHTLTGSELVALLLESQEIKTHQPLYNRAQRRSRFNYGLFSYYDEYGYLCFKIENNAQDAVPLTSFSTAQEAREFLENQVTKHQLCQKLCGLFKTTGACFYHQVKLCKGACIQAEPPGEYNARARQLEQQFEYAHGSFFLLDRGRNTTEKAVVQIKNGKYIGFGFVRNEDISEQTTEMLADSIVVQNDNREVHWIIRSYMRRQKITQIIVD